MRLDLGQILAQGPPMQVDTLILGAGAAGLMCAAHSTGRVLVVDHAKAPGEKIRISGGGRCNFTNLYCEPSAFISQNPHFCKSALARYTQWDFIELVERHGIAWHEKTLGQLFCDGSAKEIVAMLTGLCAKAGADIWLRTEIQHVEQAGDGFRAQLLREGKVLEVSAKALVLATGGKSIPKMGASGLAYKLTRQFGLKVTETRPGLVPYTFSDRRFAPISGLSVPARITTQDGTCFEEALLFTHRGLSGPAVLQTSSYWREGEAISVNIAPPGLEEALKKQRQSAGRHALKTELAKHLPARLLEHLPIKISGRLADQSDQSIATLCASLSAWGLTPSGTEGYRTAEVTVGGVDTDGISSQTMMAKTVPNLYVIGEALDVTGWLGGYNFQWAWSSAMAAARALRALNSPKAC